MKKEQSIEEIKASKEQEKKSVGDFTLEVTPNEFGGGKMETKTCFLLKPNKQIIGQVLGMITPKFEGDNPDLMNAGNVILTSCFCGGDRDILTVDEYNIAASLQVLEMVQVADSKLKKN